MINILLRPFRRSAERAERLNGHGPAGSLIQSMQRNAFLGWIFAGFILAGHFIWLYLVTVVPGPVITVDQAGHQVGQIDYLSPLVRTDDELVVASMRYAHGCLSLNSESIFEDYADCMNLMNPAFLKTTEAALKANGYLVRVAAAKTNSRLEYAGGTDAPRVIDRRGFNATVRLKGNIIVKGEGGRSSTPFDIILETRAVPRNTHNTAGLEVLAQRDN
jgi:hypothetical protein